MSHFKKLLTTLKNKTFYLHCLGCRVNQAEILQIGAFLESLGFKSSETNPGLIIVNTCAVTNKALAESKKEGRGLKEKFPQAKVLILGCGPTAQLSEFSWADLILDNREKEKILDPNYIYSPELNHPLATSKRYLLRIQTGCNSFCSYCVVPYLRKELINLSPEKVIKQIKKIKKLGFQEVILTGINLALYGKGENYRLGDLIEKMLKETKIPRIGFGSINLGAIDNKLISLFKKDWEKGKGRLNRYLHIPLQSGSDNVLKKMDRPYKVKNYRRVVNQLVSQIPLLGIGTDIIVGFPGETEQDFKKTVDLLNALPFSRLHIFRFNPREKTLAYIKEKEWGRVGEKEKKTRAKILKQINTTKQKEFRKKLKGRKLPVLFLQKTKNGEWKGLTDNYLTIKMKSRQNLGGKIKEITIT